MQATIANTNIKIIIVGGRSADDHEDNGPKLYIMELAPKFIEKKLYKTGAHVITKQYQRYLPQAKTLNMLPSYLIYREAKAADAYDALLYDTDGQLHEGTRTNVFAIKDKTLMTPPDDMVLPGVTRKTVIECAETNGFEVKKEHIKMDKLVQFDGVFLTGTSPKILPVTSIDNQKLNEIPPALQELMKLYNTFVRQRGEII